MANKEYVAGIDVGTAYIKVVIIDEKKEIIGFSTVKSGANLQNSITTSFDEAVADAGVPRDAIKHVTATGFGRRNVSFAHKVKTEISAHAKGAYYYVPKKITVVDIGGQDTKIIKIDAKGKALGFKMNRKCAAGTGTFLEEIAFKLNISMDEMNLLAAKSTKEVALSSFCTVFASTEILSRIKGGEKIEDMVKSTFESVARRVIEMDTLAGTVVMTGGVIAYNTILSKILSRFIENEILTPPHPQLIGAFGAALFAKEAKN
ncbi:ATPase [Thermoplasmatales archaeon SM1-50]|nr:MAG: ATPase [Thermoplasmatales archaeon SM1-50]